MDTFRPSSFKLVDDLLIIGFSGKKLDEPLQSLAAAVHPAGYILFKRNIETRAGVERLIADMNALHRELELPPPLMAIDHEGGLVHRLGELATRFPGNLALGIVNDPNLAEQQAFITALELRQLGFNTVFAPVLDVLTNPANPQLLNRSFGDQPEQAARLGAAMIRGYQRGGLAAAAKHFPGLGDCVLDSHHSLPIVSQPRSLMDRRELVPFRAAFAADVQLAMTAHVAYPQLDASGSPATCSARIVTDLLRREMGYGGVVVSDALEMGALAALGIENAVVEAFRAGCDVGLICADDEAVRRGHAALLEAARSGRIPALRLADARNRIVALRNWLAALRTEVPYNRAGAAAAKSLLGDIAAKAVCVVRNAGLLPLSPSRQPRILLLRAMPAKHSPVAESLLPASELLRDRLAASEFSVEFHPQLDPEQIDAAADTVIVVCAKNLFLDPIVARRWHDKMGIGRDWVWISVGVPVDLPETAVETLWLASADDGPESMSAVAAVLTGQRSATGVLPLSLTRTSGNQRETA